MGPILPVQTRSGTFKLHLTKRKPSNGLHERHHAPINSLPNFYNYKYPEELHTNLGIISEKPNQCLDRHISLKQRPISLQTLSQKYSPCKGSLPPAWMIKMFGAGRWHNPAILLTTHPTTAHKHLTRTTEQTVKKIKFEEKERLTE